MSERRAPFANAAAAKRAATRVQRWMRNRTKKGLPTDRPPAHIAANASSVTARTISKGRGR